MQLSQRLLAVADLASAGHCLADVGTDHGYIPIYLMEKGKYERAIAMDVRKGPLLRAEENRKIHGFEDRMDLRLSDGVAALREGEADTVVIAGMGGETIIAILSAAAWTKDGAHTLLLQPMTKTADLRKWLAVNEYRFTEERLVWDKNYLYPVLRVTGGECPQLTELQALTGVLLADDPLYGEYLTQHKEKLRRAAEGLRRSGRENALCRAEELEKLIGGIGQIRSTT